MRIKPFIFVFALLMLIVVQSASSALTVRVKTPKLIDTPPGQIISATFVIKNGASAGDFFEKLILPPGWQVIMPQNELLTLVPNEELSRIAAFFVPATSPSGTYQIKYQVTSQADNNLQDFDTMNVSVSSLSKVEILVTGKPGEAIDGREYQVGIAVVNRGNTQAACRLDVSSLKGFDVSINPSYLTIEAQSSKTANITVRTDGRSKEQFEHEVTIKAFSGAVIGGELYDEKQASTLIIPNSSSMYDRFIRIPAQIKLSDAGFYYNGTVESAVQMELSGSGYIDDEYKKKLSFLYRTPDLQSYGSFGLRNEYNIGYESPEFSAHAGDQMYVLSPLTERYLYGRGADFKTKIANCETGGFYAQTRFASPEQNEGGIFVNYPIDKVYSVKANVLRKSLNKTQLTSVVGSMKQNERQNINFEAALSNNYETSGSPDSAYRLEAIGVTPDNRYKYYLENVYAGPNYFGYYNDQYFTYGSFSFPLKDWKSTISVRRNNTNLSSDPLKTVADNELSISGDFTTPFLLSSELLLNAENYVNKDSCGSPDFDYSKRILRTGISKELGGLNVQGVIAMQTMDDNIIGKSYQGLNQYSVYANYSAGSGNMLSLYGNFGNDVYSSSLEGSVNCGVNLNWKVSRMLNLLINANYSKFSSVSTSKSVYASAVINLFNADSLSLGMRWSKDSGSSLDNYSFLAAYSANISIPVGIHKNLGSISGVIVDEDKPGSPPLAGAVVHAGAYRATTDKNGNYSLPFVREGHYNMWVDSETMGENRITSKKLSIIKVKANEAVACDIGVVNTSQLAGVIDIVPVSATPGSKGKMLISGTDTVKPGDIAAKDNIKIANVPVTLSNGEDELIVMTDEQGRFSADGLRPGSWKVSYDQDCIPGNYKVREGTDTVALAPSDSKLLSVALVPDIREIEMVEVASVGLKSVSVMKTRSSYAANIESKKTSNTGFSFQRMVSNFVKSDRVQRLVEVVMANPMLIAPVGTIL